MSGLTISVVWLNSSFSPPRAKDGRISDSDKKVFYALLDDLMSNQNVDIIGLCELSKNDVATITKQAARVGYSVESGIVKAGRANFDTCIVYNSKKLKLIGQQKEVLEEFNRTTKVGQLFIFEIDGDVRPLYVFASHWPSRLYLDEYNPNRLMLGKTLRSSVNQILTSTQDAHKNSLIVLMGDFNDEPFDVSLTDGLASTRDRHLVKTNPSLLYNPFWRKLGGKDDYSHGSTVDTKCGSYFYSGGFYSKWHTFDQIIVSAAFLGHSDWHLVESATEILNYQPYTDLVINKASKFDHLPVKIVLERI
ncbi:endonuclease/exonuclease/phosphatase family protein [Massilia sp. BKSP1R2A-1]|uniref:endonuclease/exonuclease/phosphatase family protein n=1 Tax=Massilia sp. BKSP1R2A-1 TaxID=3422595 RepID=UPI003D358622